MLPAGGGRGSQGSTGGGLRTMSWVWRGIERKGLLHLHGEVSKRIDLLRALTRGSCSSVYDGR